MRGFIHKRVHNRKDGKSSTLYYAVIESTPPGATKRKQDWGKGYRTRAEAERALRLRVSAFENQQYAAANRVTVGEYLTHHWLPLLRDRIKPTTLASYEQMIAVYILPRIGRIRLQELSPGHLNQLYAALREGGGRHRSKAKAGQPRPLSEKSVRNVHGLLSKAINDAIDEGLLATNVATRAKPPRSRVGTREVEAWTADELRAFLGFVAEDRLFACWFLAAHTGMRRGELLGLRWSDVDLDGRRLSVRQALTLVYTTPTILTPKSHEARVLSLDPLTVSVLQAHRQLQRQEREEYGLGYEDSGMVFRREDGQPINPDRLSQLFDKFVRQSGIRRIKFHGLRHTHATLMLAAGVPVKVVSERLGHADPAFTLRVYTHVTQPMQDQAVALFSAALHGHPADRPGVISLPVPPEREDT